MIKNVSAKKPDKSQWGNSIVFYCKDCEKVVGAKQVGKKYVYACDECGTKNVAFGTPRSINSFFRIEEEEATEEVKEEKNVTRSSPGSTEEVLKEIPKV